MVRVSWAAKPQVVNVDALQGRAFGTPNAYQVRDRSHHRDARSKKRSVGTHSTPFEADSDDASLTAGTRLRSCAALAYASRYGHTPLRGAGLKLSFVARVRNDRGSPTGGQAGAEDIGQRARRAPLRNQDLLAADRSRHRSTDCPTHHPAPASSQITRSHGAGAAPSGRRVGSEIALWAGSGGYDALTAEKGWAIYGNYDKFISFGSTAEYAAREEPSTASLV